AWAQGGVATVLDPKDTIESHVQDTLIAGAGACDESVVRLVVEQGPKRIDEMFSWGMRVDRDEGGKVMLGREGGHAAHRIIHAGGDATGAEVQRVLLDRVKQTPGIRVFANCFALDLITPNDSEGAPVMGAITHHPKFGLQMIWARSTILAAGGSGVLFRETTNPPQATADGLAMAYRAGATLADMAYMQFHPTTLYLAGASRSLITEAIRGAGAYLLDEGKNRFMLGVHPMAELAPRDIVSQAIVRQLARQGGGKVYLDCRHIAGINERFLGFAELLKKFDLNAQTDLIPIHPAAHYMVGGVKTDARARTNVPGLLAAGEVASTGLHGANRLASNSLLEGLVFGAIAGEAAADGWNGSRSLPRPGPVSIVSDIRPSDRGELDLTDVRSSLRSAMWKNVGIERTSAKLQGVAEMFDFWGRYTLDKIFDEPFGWETQNMLLVGAVMARAALWREESRGCHLRLDFPDRRDAFAKQDVWCKHGAALC
ncbi:MAG TPA: L-aspartate oxidase, partial [Phycisphaerales bacterium]|nr:L-aspartate oxidase [Phycisphaerales bacterium]